MAIIRTFGDAGGSQDHDTLHDAMDWCRANDGVTGFENDVILRQVGNSVENDSFFSNSNILFQGFYGLTIECPWDNSHQGNPTSGYTVTRTKNSVIKIKVGNLGGNYTYEGNFWTEWDIYQ